MDFSYNVAHYLTYVKAPSLMFYTIFNITEKEHIFISMILCSFQSMKIK